MCRSGSQLPVHTLASDVAWAVRKVRSHGMGAVGKVQHSLNTSTEQFLHVARLLKCLVGVCAKSRQIDIEIDMRLPAWLMGMVCDGRWTTVACFDVHSGTGRALLVVLWIACLKTPRASSASEAEEGAYRANLAMM
jgi:hypothetical protein